MSEHAKLERLKKTATWPKFIKRNNTIGQFCKADGGATVVEFAMLALPFFLIFMAIIETSLFFFAGQMLESAIDSVGREVRVGAINQTTTPEKFKERVCEKAWFFQCADIKVDLQVVSTFAELGNMPQPVDGEVKDENYGYDTPERLKIVMITAAYEWPVFTNYFQKKTSTLKNGNTLLTAVSAFQTEPY